MKRKLFLLAFSLIVILGAALWGVNWRLNHPPMTKADREFRALVAGADRVKASQMSCQNRRGGLSNYLIEYELFDAEQTRELIAQLRLADEKPKPEKSSTFVTLNLTFLRQGKAISHFMLWQTSQSSGLLDGSKELTPLQGYKVHPRFEKPLNRYLDAVLPRRIKPQ